MEVFNRICEAWSLSAEERSKLIEAGSKGNKLANISYVTGIYNALHTLFKSPSQANEWVRLPNPEFDGRSALDVMFDGPGGLKKVRQYLDTQKI